ncbi:MULTISPECIES: AMP-binding protein [unclassified Dietzia]|uniref:AMP-binding protein n=1 Tax=unclassified Dietzia TaxID=2617939 RepID=UPI000D21A8B2|nr:MULTISPECIES: AMP-binding protein [unclassified Dietzia]AVZ39859.1 acyl-CoA synthetase [Dietzia sp. JS16-p6b]QGW25236.1 acyl-CoA synthetase [Dietzia sp. DQ12-45-1b]
MPPTPDIVSAALKTATSYVLNAVEVLRFGGLQTDEEPSPFEIVARRPMFRLRRYYPPPAANAEHGGAGDGEDAPPRPPILLVPPMMISADVWDVSPSTSAVAALHEAGMDPWVIDFGAPDIEAGGLERTLTDHVIAVSDAVDLVTTATGRSVHLGGYSQGGMFCYQAAAYRRSRDLASVVTFGSPVDWRGHAPLGIPEEVVVTIARFVADYVFADRPLPGWLASTAFRLLDPIKTARSQVDFLRQLHDRDALLGHERQRRFIGGEGFVAWSGPAIVDMMRQVIIQNRMMVGGFVVGEHVVSLADITCPVLAVFGEVDEIGVPAGVRKIASVAPGAEVYEFSVRAGHFGLVVGSTAASQTWPTVAAWMGWREGTGQRPDGIAEVEPGAVVDSSPTTAIMLAADGAFQVAGLGIGAVRGVGHLAVGTLKATRAVGYQALHAAPRLIRLGQIQPRTRISFARIMTERARNQPDDACFLFSDRVHTFSAVDTRITNVVKGLIAVGVRQGDHIGVLMETRPSALVAMAALSRLGAVAVLLPPSQSLPELLRLSSVTDVVTDPEHASKVSGAGARALVLGGGSERDLPADLDAGVVDLEQIDPETVELPRWYRPDPGRAGDLAFVFFSRSTGVWQTKLVTNHRWALSAFGTASAARLSGESTVYCLSPLHHPSGLLTAVGGAVAGGSRIALSQGFDPATFDEEVRRYGVTVVTYTWAMMRGLVRRPAPPRQAHSTITLFMGSGMPRGLWRRVLDRYPGTRVLEFYAGTEADVVLANLSTSKPGARGRPLPGTSEVRLVDVDPDSGAIAVGPDGFAIPSEVDAPGMLLTRPRLGVDASVRQLRGVFRPGDTWVSTSDYFERDRDGDFWILGAASAVVHTAHGPVYPVQVADALGDLPQVDLAVLYEVPGASGPVAVAAVNTWGSEAITAADVGGALASVPPAARPDIVHVVKDIPVTNWYRPDSTGLADRGLPKAGPRTWVLDADSGQYVRLTKAVRDGLSPSS